MRSREDIDGGKRPNICTWELHPKKKRYTHRGTQAPTTEENREKRRNMGEGFFVCVRLFRQGDAL